ncbi:MAG: RNA polymerase sigma factor [Oscillospiraceae bacterium]|nr:RNA polymerase sigma factor [Oscillospiraceae bacterium]MBQ7130489.1 RNA polymerase sigma factor [Oscillospiraceae bacterium]
MEDERIVSLYWSRDEQAIQETQIKYDRYLTKIAYNILNNQEDTRESVNDTYFAAWNSIPPHRPSVLSAYLAKLTRRISIDCFRYRTREKRLASEYAISLSELDDCISGGNTTEELVNVKLLADAIGIFLRLQSEEARTAFLGRYYFLDSVKEVAAYCGMTESKCKSLLHRTRLGLKAYLEQEGFFV